MRRFILIITFLICATSASLAQSIENNPVVRESLDHMFQHLSKFRVPTGLLRDYAFELVDFDLYDGSTLSDENYIDYTKFELMLRSIYSANFTNLPTLRSVNNIINSILEAQTSTTIPIAIALYKYSYISEDALNESKILYSNGQVYDAYTDDNTWINPYEMKYIFGFTPVKNVLSTGTYQFSFTNNATLSNMQFSKVEFDPGLGTGYITISSSGDYEVTYLNEGTYEQKLRITLKDGTVLNAHSALCILNNSVSSGEFGDDGPVEYNEDFTSSRAYCGVTTTATLRCYYKKGNSNITNPYIIVEGFDPVLSSPYLYGFTCLESEDPEFISRLRDEYDVFYVEYNTPNKNTRI